MALWGPGGTLTFLGGLLGAFILFSPWDPFDRRLETIALLGSGACFLAGFEILCLGLFATLITRREGILAASPAAEKIASSMTLESGIVAGLLGSLLGIFLLGSEALAQHMDFRVTILAITIIVLGVKMVFGSFYLETIKQQKRQWKNRTGA